jgi:hypothetical protein
MMKAHEWAWGAVDHRTVCGLGGASRLSVVCDLGPIDPARRCRKCDRLRAAFGASSRLISDEPPPVAADSPLAVALEQVAEGLGALTEDEQHILEHTTGWLTKWPLYRNHFCTGEGSDDWATIARLIDRGLMRVSRKPSQLSGGDTVFCVTAIGLAALKRGSRGAVSGEQVATDR